MVCAAHGWPDCARRQAHAGALGKAANALGEVIGGISTLPTDLVSEDLREALRALGSITGEILLDEILGVVFERFRIGK